MHDIFDLERRGLPGVLVASAPFLDAATAQADALGFEARAVFVEHPIQDRTDDEMKEIADTAIQDAVDSLTITGETFLLKP